MNKSPIFIHSLFRAGSTYMFNVFRRSELRYWCYQEPLHEVAVLARDEPEILLEDHGEEKARLLRHPLMNNKYFQELHDTWPAWRDALSESAVYSGYFAPPNIDIGISYWRALIDAARGRPVFQECRTSGRIDAIKEQLGGYHIYLWRNPWDQWWSHKVAPYFDAANRLIINAPNAPSAVLALRDALGLEAYPHDDIRGAFAYYGETPLGSEESYLVFYLLWCLGLSEGNRHAQLLLNIDRLSDSLNYQKEIQAKLEKAGVAAIDLSDCAVPQGRYFDQDLAFFGTLEEKVHNWLIEGGYSQNDYDKIHALRQQFRPASWSKPIGTLSFQDVTEQAKRARALVVRLETSAATKIRGSFVQLSDIKVRAEMLQCQLSDNMARLESRVNELAHVRQQLTARETELINTQQQLTARETELINYKHPAAAHRPRDRAYKHPAAAHRPRDRAYKHSTAAHGHTSKHLVARDSAASMVKTATVQT